MDIRVDMSENAARLGKQFLETVAELALLKQQIERDIDTDTARTHIGAFATMLQDAGLEGILREEFEIMRRSVIRGGI